MIGKVTLIPLEDEHTEPSKTTGFMPFIFPGVQNHVTSQEPQRGVIRAGSGVPRDSLTSTPPMRYTQLPPCDSWMSLPVDGRSAKAQRVFPRPRPCS